jgi:hypothetical protein
MLSRKVFTCSPGRRPPRQLFSEGRGRASGIAALAGCLLAVASSTVAIAASKEEVARCRAIEQRAERLGCFKALKQTAKAKTKGGESSSSAERGNGAPAQAEVNTAPKIRDAAPPPTSHETATTAAINPLSVAPGQPLCVDRDALAAVLVAGLLTSNPEEAATIGCQTLPSDAKLELLERRWHAGIFPFMRMIKVKVTSPTKPDLTVGFTIEMVR